MDPLFLMTPNCIDGHEEDSLNEPYGQEITSISTRSGQHSYPVRIKFSIAKEETQDREGKGGKLGQKIYGKLVGVSLLRAKRELKHDDFGFVSDKNEYRHRWWSCEVEFPPALDELFKVTNDKQEARGFRHISKDEYEDEEAIEDESLELMYQISKLVMTNIDSMMKIIKARKKGSRRLRKCPECGALAVKDTRCEQCGYVLDHCATHKVKLVDGVCAMCVTRPPDAPLDTMCTVHNIPLVDNKCSRCEKQSRPPTVDEKRALEKHLSLYYSEFAKNQELLEVAMSHFVKSGRRHYIVYVSVPGSAFIMPDQFGQLTIIAVNTQHSFYDRFMGPKIENRDEAHELVPIHMLIGAWVHAEQGDYDHSKELYDTFRDRFGMNLKELMLTYQLE